MGIEETKEKVVEVALEMFNQRGCRGVTMDDVAQAVHISKRTLYETFANKEELLAESLKRVHDYINERHLRAHGKVDEPLLVALYMLRTNANYSHKYNRLLEEAERYYPELHDRYFKIHTDALRGYIYRGMEYARQHGYLRVDANIETAVDFMCDFIQQHRMSDVADHKAYAERVNEVCFTYMRGLMSVDTIARYEKAETHFRQLMEELDKGMC